MTARVEIYKARSKKADRMDWYWRFRKNGNIMADGGGYSRRIDCVTGCAIVLGGRHRDYRQAVEGGGEWIWTIGRTVPVVDLTKKETS